MKGDRSVSVKVPSPSFVYMVIIHLCMPHMLIMIILPSGIHHPLHHPRLCQQLVPEMVPDTPLYARLLLLGNPSCTTMTMAVMAEWVLGFDLDQAAHELDMWDQIGTVAMATNGDHGGGRWWAEAHSTDGCAWGVGLMAPDRDGQALCVTTATTAFF